MANTTQLNIIYALKLEDFLLLLEKNLACGLIQMGQFLCLSDQLKQLITKFYFMAKYDHRGMISRSRRYSSSQTFFGLKLIPWRDSGHRGRDNF